MLSERELKRHAANHVRHEVAKEVARQGGVEKVSRDELEELAARVGVTVTRADGKEGEPLKSDFANALGL